MRFVSFAVLALSCGLFAQTPIQLHVDATDAPRRVFHVQMTMPAQPGPMTLLYPQWIPGEHGPTGPVVNLVGLKILGGGKTIAWKRDSVNLYAFAFEVPAGVSSLDIAFDYLAPPESEGFTSGASTTSELAVLNWNQVLLYPKGADADSMQLQASLKVPSGWRYGTALPIQRETGNDVEFKPASLTTLIDSPISAGAHYRTIDLGEDLGAQHYLHLAADSDRALEISPELIGQYKNLVKETGALFGSRHYRSYHFLYTLSDHVAHFGLEHHESSDDRYNERTLIDPEVQKVSATLLSHEFAHSWNGKYRRPAGDLDNKYGRTWRSLEDTAVAAQILYYASWDYDNYRRDVDYYPEGILIWLEADVMIRQLSNGTRSLDDFCRAFHGGAGGAPELKPYNFDDIVAGLNAIQPYDWAGFLNQRLHSTDAHAPLGGIEHAGWKLAYDGVRSDFWKAGEDGRKWTDLSYSIGLKVREDGTIANVQYGGPAQKAGVAPSTKLIAVNNRQFTPTVLRETVAKTSSSDKPLELLVKTGDYYEVHRLDYHGGERYPHLVRDASLPDLLSEIVKAHAKAQ